MKRVKILIGFLTLSFCFSAYQLYSLISYRTIPLEIKANPNYRISIDEKNLLEEGDIILRRGEGFVSSVISNLNEADYQISHCAILVQKDSVEWYVIHTVSSDLSDIDGVQTEKLDRFTSESVDSTIVVLRFKADKEKRQQIAERARYYLYKKIPFDNAFNIADSTEFYCSELIYKVFLDVMESDVFEERHQTNHPNFLTFNVFLDNRKFDIIINHQHDKVTRYFKN
ncbi:MAG: hypothetical protein H3C64_07540 [Candidatus Kuenenia stuttgartiensis]|nr:hypothetical protein [Candidatus Kuenenia stuttgartiensis]MCZ2443040.1 hypothetical protein [Flavobacteriales bacterium]